MQRVVKINFDSDDHVGERVEPDIVLSLQPVDGQLNCFGILLSRDGSGAGKWKVTVEPTRRHVAAYPIDRGSYGSTIIQVNDSRG